MLSVIQEDYLKYLKNADLNPICSVDRLIGLLGLNSFLTVRLCGKVMMEAK